ncbi:hypothetical protein [Demequina pelophila]|uniref:hypothetical protein n=1 Tax=Demequina pelophila TaxID=1638984 RepID=UPI0009E5DB38|nr:hypothetical protein [Demequina pelophila]
MAAARFRANSGILPGDAVYIDESKARGYILAAVAVAPVDRGEARRRLRRLLPKRQRRLHFKSESDPRRRALLSELAGLSVRATVWQVSGKPDRIARPLCLEAAAGAALDAGASELVLERDASLEAADRRTVGGVLRARRAPSGFAYRHASPYDEPLLWVSDAVAWCHQKGGDWSRRAGALVEGRVIRL